MSDYEIIDIETGFIVESGNFSNESIVPVLDDDYDPSIDDLEKALDFIEDIEDDDWSDDEDYNDFYSDLDGWNSSLLFDDENEDDD